MNKTRTAVGLAALAALGIVALPNTTHAATASWQYVDLNGDGRTEAAAIDRNLNGMWEEVWVNLNFDSAWDASLFDYDGNGTFEWLHVFAANGAHSWQNTNGASRYVFMDRDGNGRFENHYYDQTGDGFSEWTLVDTNADGHADTWRSSVTATPTSTGSASARAANDMMVQHIVTMNQIRISGW